MKKFTKKQIIITTCALAAIILTFIGINAYIIYENNKQDNAYMSQISNVYKEFSSAKAHSEKLKDLNKLLKDYNDYKKSKKKFKDVTNEYKNKINKMKEYFINDYDKSINENTLKDLDKITDKVKVTTVSTNLTSILKTIQNDKVCSSKQINEYKDKIDKLILSYNNRVKAIEDAEAKAKAKAEADAKAKEAEEAKAATAKQQVNPKTQTSKNTGHVTHPPMSSYDENGNYKGYMDYYGNFYDANGNYTGSLKDIKHPIFNHDK